MLKPILPATWIIIGLMYIRSGACSAPIVGTVNVKFVYYYRQHGRNCNILPHYCDKSFFVLASTSAKILGNFHFNLFDPIQQRIYFGSHIGQLANPLMFRFTNRDLSPNDSIQVNIEVIDLFAEHNIMCGMSKNLSVQSMTMFPNNTVSRHWTRQSFEMSCSGHTLRFEVWITCQPNYYQAGCSVHCDPSRFSCSRDGSRVCPEGFMPHGDSCIMKSSVTDDSMTTVSTTTASITTASLTSSKTAGLSTYLTTKSSTRMPSPTKASTTTITAPETAALTKHSAATATTIASSTTPATTIASSTTPATTIASSTTPATTIASSNATAATIASLTATTATIASSTTPATTIASSTATAATIASSTTPATTIASSTTPATTIASSTTTATTSAIATFSTTFISTAYFTKIISTEMSHRANIAGSSFRTVSLPTTSESKRRNVLTSKSMNFESTEQKVQKTTEKTGPVEITTSATFAGTATLKPSIQSAATHRSTLAPSTTSRQDRTKSTWVKLPHMVYTSTAASTPRSTKRIAKVTPKQLEVLTSSLVTRIATTSASEALTSTVADARGKIVAVLNTGRSRKVGISLQAIPWTLIGTIILVLCVVLAVVVGFIVHIKKRSGRRPYVRVLNYPLDDRELYRSGREPPSESVELRYTDSAAAHPTVSAVVAGAV